MDIEDNIMKYNNHISSINVRNKVPVISNYCWFVDLPLFTLFK